MSTSDTTVTRISIPESNVNQPVFTLPLSVVTWGSSVCMLCAQHFDYIKQDRMPVPKVCKGCGP
jgi:hypothetical protein